MPSCVGFLKPKKSRLRHFKSTFNVENFVCIFSMSISTGFALEMCLAARNRQKIYKNLYFSVQGHPRSLNSVAIESQYTTFY